MHIAARYDHVRIALYLLRHGELFRVYDQVYAQIYSKCQQNFFLRKQLTLGLIKPSSLCLIEFWTILGARKDAKDMDGWTPLHVATYYDNYGVMSILLEAGADVFALDCDLNYPINHIMNGLNF